MELYTEEQVRRAYDEGYLNGASIVEVHNVDEFLASLTPIELPTDEEIDDKAIEYAEYTGVRYWFSDGANWMKEQITKQLNK